MSARLASPSALFGIVAFLVVVLQASASISEVAATESSGRHLHRAKPPFRVIAFGDSTTQGWVPKLNKSMPYTVTLEAMLKQRFENKRRQRRVQVVNEGLGYSAVLGKGVRPAVLPHCRKKLAEAKAKGIVYDWVIMWIGQNDLLGMDAKADDVMSALRPWLFEVLDGGSNLMLISPVSYKEIPRKDPKVFENKRLASLYQRFADTGSVRNSRKRKSPRRIRFVNLRYYGFNPYMSNQVQYNRIFDKWHLTEEGYRIVGKRVFQQMFK